MSDLHKNEDAFDAAMRESYRTATDSTSMATRARLRQARHAAAAGGARRSGFSWPLLIGGAAAAVFAVAFVLGLRQQSLPAPDAAAPTPVATTGDYEEPASALDQDPDFYAWLGSSDAELVAVE